MGDLDNWMDENFIKGAFGAAMGDQVSVKIIRDRQSGYVFSSPLLPLYNTPLPMLCLVPTAWHIFSCLLRLPVLPAPRGGNGGHLPSHRFYFSLPSFPDLPRSSPAT